MMMALLGTVMLALLTLACIACAIGTLFPFIMGKACSVLGKVPSAFSKYRKINFQFYAWSAFMILGFIGWNIIFYNGFLGALWFVPEHNMVEGWKSHLAGILSFLLSVGFLLRLESVSRFNGGKQS